MKVAIDIKVADSQWTRTVETNSLKGAQMLCTYAERLFELVDIPAKFTARSAEAEE
jgi:hypothetical protein